MTPKAPDRARSEALGQVTALVIGFVVECAAALLFWSLHVEALFAGVASVMCGVAAYAWCGGFQRDRRHSRSPSMKPLGTATVNSRSD
jgi:hypothetical protein